MWIIKYVSQEGETSEELMILRNEPKCGYVWGDYMNTNRCVEMQRMNGLFNYDLMNEWCIVILNDWELCINEWFGVI